MVFFLYKIQTGFCFSHSALIYLKYKIFYHNCKLNFKYMSIERKKKNCANRNQNKFTAIVFHRNNNFQS